MKEKNKKTLDEDTQAKKENTFVSNEEKEESSCIENKETDYLEMAQRIKAEFENYKRRNAEVSSNSYTNGIITCVTKLLPAIDSFQQAKSNIEDPSVISGLDLIFSQILKGLGELHVEKIESLGKQFDPNLHNAILVGKDENYEDNIVLEEYQAGFILKDRVIRYTTVKVNKLN